MAAVITSQAGRRMTLLAGVLAAMLIAIYFFYFQAANAKFAANSLNAKELSAELARWAQWHWARVCVGMTAFVASLLGLQADARQYT